MVSLGGRNLVIWTGSLLAIDFIAVGRDKTLTATHLHPAQ